MHMRLRVSQWSLTQVRPSALHTVRMKNEICDTRAVGSKHVKAMRHLPALSDNLHAQPVIVAYQKSPRRNMLFRTLIRLGAHVQIVQRMSEMRLAHGPGHVTSFTFVTCSNKVSTTCEHCMGQACHRLSKLPTR